MYHVVARAHVHSTRLPFLLASHEDVVVLRKLCLTHLHLQVHSLISQGALQALIFLLKEADKSPSRLHVA